MTYERNVEEYKDLGWLAVLEFNGPLRQYFSLYRDVSKREGDGYKDMATNRQGGK